MWADAVLHAHDKLDRLTELPARDLFALCQLLCSVDAADSNLCNISALSFAARRIEALKKQQKDSRLISHAFFCFSILYITSAHAMFVD